MNPVAPVSISNASATDANAADASKDTKPKPEVLKAAREFEAIFLRSLLSPLEKSTQLSGRSQVAGQSAYGSMVVGALADTMSSAGGIGLTDIIAKAMMSRAEPHKGESVSPDEVRRPRSESVSPGEARRPRSGG